MAKMSMKMIEMYVAMVKADFGPIRRQLNVEENNLRELVRREVREELGIYDLHVEKKKLEVRLQEIEEQLKRFEENKKHRKIDGRYTWVSKLDEMVEDRMKERRSDFSLQVSKAEENAIKKIKLTGITGNAADVFDKLPATLKKLEKAMPKVKLIE